MKVYTLEHYYPYEGSIVVAVGTDFQKMVAVAQKERRATLSFEKDERGKHIAKAPPMRIGPGDYTDCGDWYVITSWECD